MTISIDADRFEAAHQAFLGYMLKRSGKPFTSFEHDFFFDHEIRYKMRIIDEAHQVLQTGRWARWRKSPGKILHAVRAACSPRVSQNLLEHRYGPPRPFVKAKSKDVRHRLETAIYNLFTGDPAPNALGPRFSDLVVCLRDNHLGCAWPFVAYLAFLVSPQYYFPIRPSRFEKLLRFYRVDAPKLTGHVDWSRYSTLLDLASTLRDRLLRYGPGRAVEIQSYMWIVSLLISRGGSVVPGPMNLAEELKRREALATERERIGLAGEEFVYQEERRKLEGVGRRDLAKRVELASYGSNERGYDVRSFDSDGRELHIEVKTTRSTMDGDPGFWLTDTEKRTAETDSAWTLYRVWDIDRNPLYENVGNVVITQDAGWMLVASNWFVRRS